MIRANYTVEDNTHTLTVHGHANYDEYGRDIVCAGASALIQALLGWVEAHPYDVEADCISVDETNAEVIISCRGETDVATAFNLVATGLEQLSYSYPDHVYIDIIGTDD
jgi:uncharacterized protein YsxB (DUF464 family)